MLTGLGAVLACARLAGWLERYPENEGGELLREEGARRAFLCRKREENRHNPVVQLAVNSLVGGGINAGTVEAEIGQLTA